MLSTLRAVLIAVAIFACGYSAGRSNGNHLSGEPGRQLQATHHEDCPLEALLGLEPSMARLAVTKLAGGLQAEAGAFVPLVQHPGSKTILQDAFVKLHHLLFQHRPPLLPLHEWGARGPKSKNFSSFAAPGSQTHAAMTLSINRRTVTLVRLSSLALRTTDGSSARLIACHPIRPASAGITTSTSTTR